MREERRKTRSEIERKGNRGSRRCSGKSKSRGDLVYKKIVQREVRVEVVKEEEREEKNVRCGERIERNEGDGRKERARERKGLMISLKERRERKG